MPLSPPVVLLVPSSYISLIKGHVEHSSPWTKTVNTYNRYQGSLIYSKKERGRGEERRDES